MVGIHLLDEDIVCTLLKNEGVFNTPVGSSVLCVVVDLKGVFIISKITDLTGSRFGSLTAVSRAASITDSSGRKRSAWLCECDCGTRKIISTDNLKSGRVKSCGCTMGPLMRRSKGQLGESKTSLYNVWMQMKYRCTKPNVTHYKEYGGRGIRVCDEWMSSYKSFRDWAMLSGYKEGLTIDRIDNDGNYEPDNCRWVDSVAQANNRRSNRSYTYNGETYTLTQWANKIGINPKALFSRIYAGYSFEDAINK